jgi:hypothetical protein
VALLVETLFHQVVIHLIQMHQKVQKAEAEIVPMRKSLRRATNITRNIKNIKITKRSTKSITLPEAEKDDLGSVEDLNNIVKIEEITIQEIKTHITTVETNNLDINHHTIIISMEEGLHLNSMRKLNEMIHGIRAGTFRLPSLTLTCLLLILRKSSVDSQIFLSCHPQLKLGKRRNSYGVMPTKKKSKNIVSILYLLYIIDEN